MIAHQTSSLSSHNAGGAGLWLCGFLVLLEDLESSTRLVCVVRGTEPPETAAEEGESVTSN